MNARKVLLLATVVTFVGELNGQPILYYRGDAAAHAVAYCNSTAPGYCNLEDQGSVDCINFVSQILQKGGLGICENWWHGEPIDPQFPTPPPDGPCLACGQHYTVQWVVEWAIPRFQTSAQFSNHGWQVCGPYDYDNIDEDRPDAHYLMQGDVILVDWHDAGPYWESDEVGHSMWVYSHETNENFNCIVTYHTNNTCPSEEKTFRWWLDYWNGQYSDFENADIYLCFNWLESGSETGLASCGSFVRSGDFHIDSIRR